MSADSETADDVCVTVHVHGSAFSMRASATHTIKWLCLAALQRFSLFNVENGRRRQRDSMRPLPSFLVPSGVHGGRVARKDGQGAEEVDRWFCNPPPEVRKEAGNLMPRAAGLI